MGIAVAVYAGVGVTVLAALGSEQLAASDAPLAAAVAAGSWDWAGPVVRAGAAAAALGALLVLIAGIGRTSLATARHADLPRWLAAIHPRHQVPHHAELALVAVVCLLVLTVDLRRAIGLSSFGVLLYYFVANVAAWTQSHERCRFPRWLQVLGAAGCLVLVATLPWTAVVTGSAVLAAGVLYRVARLRLAGR